MLLYFFILFFLYFFFIGILLYGWGKINPPYFDEILELNQFVSVVIAIRNEEKNLPRLLNCLSEQSLSPDQFEVIIVDDHSEDRSIGEIRNYKNKSKLNIILLKNDAGQLTSSPKKAALKKGIGAARGDIIVTTDGDCWFEKDWLRSMIYGFLNKKTMFVAGPVALHSDNHMLPKIQQLEFSSLIGTTAALIGLNYPLMCNGANLAFRKSAFYQVNGYEGFETNSSGDDVFLMQKVHKSAKKSVFFLKDAKALVYSMPQPTVLQLIHQRKRWASKWNQHLVRFSWILPVFLFVHYFSYILVFPAFFFAFDIMWKVIPLVIFKFILDYIFLKKVLDFCKLHTEFWILLLSEFVYPIYALFIGVSVHSGNYTWKGRAYKV